MARKKIEDIPIPEEGTAEQFPIDSEQPAAEEFFSSVEPDIPFSDIPEGTPNETTEDASPPEEPPAEASPDTADEHGEPVADDLSALLAGLDVSHAPEEPEGATPPEEAPPAETQETPPGKPKRVRRKKAVEAEEVSAPLEESPAPARRRARDSGILTIEAGGEVTSEEDQEEAVWHEIRNAYRTRRILTGTLGGIEQTENGRSLVIVEYKGFRVVIPIKEMMLNIGRSPSGGEYAELMRRQNKILSTMLGAEIDFVIKGIESKSRSIVASRKEAMLKKRQIFYLNPDDAGMYRIHEGRVVQARVIAAAEKVIRVEAFGVECSILARDLSWDWIGDARERFSVGDHILIRILEVQRGSLEDITIRADVKSVSGTTSRDNLKKCRIQCKYAGKVTDIHKGVVYVRLTNGVNAIAHACYDRRMPGKKDDVSFAVTRIDEDYGVAVGIITRIIKQNL